MLTVGVPVYNAEPFLERCLNTLCAETIDYRILIADNASTDATQDIATDFARRDTRIVYHRHDQNMGAENNFTWLLDQAGTELYAWRAYDDTSTPGYFQKLARALEDQPRANLAVGGTRFIDSDDNPPRDRNVPATLPEDPAQRRRELFKHFSKSWYYGVYRREALARRYHQTLDAYKYTWTFDTLMLLPFILEARIVTAPDVYFTQYLSGLSASRYRPKGFFKPAHMMACYCRMGFGFVDELEPALTERLAMYRDVVAFAHRSGEKFDRIAKRALFWPYYKATGRL